MGGVIGFAAAQAILYVAGEPVLQRSMTLSLLPVLALPLLLHGVHLHAEEVIEAVAPTVWPFSMCR